ncbi:MAG: DNA repair protein RecN [Planctomycetota bacterium]
MLRELNVQNLAIIEDLRVELEQGYCAWTGETGAGKTLLLQALGLLLGERGASELIRAGADELRVTGRFELASPRLRAAIGDVLAMTLDDSGELLVVRRLTRQGRSYVYANDQPVTLATLRTLAGILVDIHGQRDSQALLDPVYQLRMLDAFGQLEPQRLAFETKAAELKSIRQTLDALDAQKQQRQRELSLIRFERDELDKAELVPGELGDLLKEREKLLHASTLYDFAFAACNQLYDEDGSLSESISKIEREAEHNARFDPDLEPIAKRLQALASEAQDLAHSLRAWTQRSEADPARQEFVETRVQKIRRLETKYGKSVDELIDYRRSLDAQEAALVGQDENRDTLEESLTAGLADLAKIGGKLGKERQKIGKTLVARVQKELIDLAMPEAKLEASWELHPLGDDPRVSDLPSHGLESFELLLAANPGEPALPLRKVASGGEMSRTMLALKSVLAGHVEVGTTMVFDEIDANVGGRLGDVLGAKLAVLGREHQVICVTHLPQVASFAKHHWTIRKEKQGKRTITTITYLDEKARIEELASMLRGEAREATTLKEAAAMLAAAKKKW